MSSRSVLSMGRFFLISLLSASTIIFPVNLTLFSGNSWYFLVTGNTSLSLNISFSGEFIVTGDLVSTMNTFLVPSILIAIVMQFFRSVICLISLISFIDMSVSLSSVSTVSVSCLISCRFCCSNLHAFAKWPFFNLWHITSQAGHLWFGFQFRASQYLQFRSSCVSFDLVSYCLVYVISFTGSFLMSFSRFHNRFPGMLFFLFFRSYVFCRIGSTTFGISKCLSFNSLSRNILSVIDVINFNISKSVLIAGKFYILPISCNSSQWSSLSPYLFALPKTNLLLSCICFPFGRYYLLYRFISLSVLILSESVWYSDLVIWCIASGPNAHRKSCCTSSSLVLQSLVPVLFLLNLVIQYRCHISFLYIFQIGQAIFRSYKFFSHRVSLVQVWQIYSVVLHVFSV